MKSYYCNFFIYCIIICLFIACVNKNTDNTGQKLVYIHSSDGKYIFYRNGQPFFIKGGAGYTCLKQLKDAGGNTIRLWDTLNIAKVLDSARYYNLAVIVGLPMPANDDMDAFYNNDDKVKKHLQQLTAIVNKYKHHPALLCWCVGNELAFPYKPNYNRFYNAFNNVIDMIHTDDPDHPVTTTIMTFQTKNIINLKLRTKVDFISFNIFGSIQTLKKDLENFKWFWSGPFLITEWGVEGPWLSGEQNAWGAYVENTSNKKAEQYLSVYKNYMPVDNNRFLGSLVFYWGQKQELTPTWFSLFDKNGAPTETVNVMQYVWTGKYGPAHAPLIKYMLVNGKGGYDNIFLKPDTTASAKTYMLGNDTAGLTYKWELMPEDWYKKNGIFSEKSPRPLINAIIENKGDHIVFKTPAKEGPYRLLVYIYNKNGYFATCNTPVYVLNNP